MKTKKLYILMAGWMDAKGSLWPEDSGNKIPTWEWMDEKTANKVFDGLKMSDFEENEAKIANYLLSGMRPYVTLESFAFPVNILKKVDRMDEDQRQKFLKDYANYDFKEEREKYLEFPKDIKIFAWTFEHRARLQHLYEDFLRDTKETKMNLTDFMLFMYAKEREKLNVEAN